MIRFHSEHFAAWKDVMASTFQLWHWPQIKNQSIDAYLLENNIPAKFHPDSIWNGIFKEVGAPQQEEQEEEERQQQDE